MNIKMWMKMKGKKGKAYFFHITHLRLNSVHKNQHLFACDDHGDDDDGGDDSEGLRHR